MRGMGVEVVLCDALVVPLWCCRGLNDQENNKKNSQCRATHTGHRAHHTQTHTVRSDGEGASHAMIQRWAGLLSAPQSNNRNLVMCSYIISCLRACFFLYNHLLGVLFCSLCVCMCARHHAPTQSHPHRLLRSRLHEQLLENLFLCSKNN